MNRETFDSQVPTVVEDDSAMNAETILAKLDLPTVIEFLRKNNYKV